MSSSLESIVPVTHLSFTEDLNVRMCQYTNYLVPKSTLIAIQKSNPHQVVCLAGENRFVALCDKAALVDAVRHDEQLPSFSYKLTGDVFEYTVSIATEEIMSNDEPVHSDVLLGILCKKTLNPGCLFSLTKLNNPYFKRIDYYDGLFHDLTGFHPSRFNEELDLSIPADSEEYKHVPIEERYTDEDLQRLCARAPEQIKVIAQCYAQHRVYAQIRKLMLEQAAQAKQV